jgi:hypothetical protein
MHAGQNGWLTGLPNSSDMKAAQSAWGVSWLPTPGLAGCPELCQHHCLHHDSHARLATAWGFLPVLVCVSSCQVLQMFRALLTPRHQERIQSGRCLKIYTAPAAGCRLLLSRRAGMVYTSHAALASR